MKIVYVVDTLARKGGAERVIIDKMDYMVSHFGYTISIITCCQDKDTPNAYPIPDSIKQVYLGVPYYSQYHYRYPYRLWVKHSINCQMKKALTDAVQTIDPDILIGVSYFQANIVAGIKCKAKKLIEVHEPRPFSLSDYELSRGRLSSWYMKHYRNWYFRKVENQADIVVTLTPGDAHEWRRAKKVQLIPNFTVIPIEKLSDGQAKRVIAVGRLGWVKGYDRLISAWKIVSEKHPDWQLDIFGDGDMRVKLKQKIKLENIKNVTLCGTTNNISKVLSESSICVSTSYYEGFSLALLEAITHGVPCVAFDCPYGPRTIIEDGKCGYLVQDNNIPLFAEKLCSLMENEQLRLQFSKASVERSKIFNIDSIMLQWKKLFEKM